MIDRSISPSPEVSNLDSPPHDPLVEEALLGSVLVMPEVLDEPDLAAVRPGDFFIHRNGFLWKAYQRLHSAERPIDVLTVAGELGRMKKLTDVGGDTALRQLLNKTPSSVHATDYAKTIREFAVRRGMIERATKLVKVAWSADGNLATELDGVLADARLLVTGLHEGQALDPIAWGELRSKVGAIEWLWPGWIPKGLLGVLSAEQMAGKSILGLVLAKTINEGLPWPDGQEYTGETGQVVWIDSEGQLAVNLERLIDLNVADNAIIKPRVDTEGITEADLLTDVGWAAFIKALKYPGVKLAIIDSLGGVFEDESSPAVKTFCQRLAVLAAETGIPILLIHHPRKPQANERHGVITMDRIRGHGGITQFSRSVIAIQQPDPASPDQRAVESLKMSIMRKPKPFGFTLAANDDKSLSYVNLDQAPEEPRKLTLWEKAWDWMREFLQDGPIEYREVLEQGSAHGHSKNSLYKAKEKKDVVTVERDEGTCWSLSTRDTDPEPYIPN
ncbi:MAG: AAA family ATPase [Chloroflexi bacterium]|nr:AAA family ATPase [Chloroflexota bacterium]